MLHIVILHKFVIVAVILGLSATCWPLPHVAAAHGQFRRQTNSAQQVTVYAVVGHQVVLPCNSNYTTKADWSKDVSETNKPTFKLITSDGEVQNGYVVRFSYTRSEDGWQNLTINNAQLQDAGLYKCHKDGGIGEAIYVQLYIRDQPFIGQSTIPPAAGTRPDTMYKSVETGSRVSFPCLVGTRRILWRHYDETLHVKNISIDGLILRDFIDRFSIGRSYEDNNQLVINNARRSDAGQYECVADNGLGDSHSFVLFVTDREPEFISQSSQLSTISPINIGTSDLGITNGLLIAILVTIIVFGVIIMLKFIIPIYRRNRSPGNARSKSKANGCKENSNSNIPLLQTVNETSGTSAQNDQTNDESVNLHETWLLNDNEVNDERAATRYHFRLLQTVKDSASNFCYFSELNDIYCMVDRSGNFTTFKHNSTENGNCSFDKLYDFPSVEPFTPSGFTSSRKNECFYVGNRFKRCVYRITLKVEEKEVKVEGFIPSMTADNEHPLSLSALPDGRLLVLVAIEQPFSRKWFGRIELYRADGNLQMTIKPPNHVVYPWCAVYTGIDQSSGNDTFALTYGSNESGVIRLDSENRTLAECKKGMWMIRGIKYDKTNDSIYIVDVSNCLILQLDLKLQSPTVIHDWRSPTETVTDEIQPVRITLNGDETHMIVGFESGRVSFYSFERPK